MRGVHALLLAALVAGVMAMPYVTDEESIVPETELVSNDGSSDDPAAIAKAVAAKSKAEGVKAQAKTVESSVDTDAKALADTAEVAEEIIKTTVLVKNNEEHAKDAVKATSGEIKTVAEKVESEQELALAKCQQIKTKVYENCRRAMCVYDEKCSSKGRAKQCLSEEASYFKAKAYREHLHKDRMKKEAAKEVKHKSWLAGKDERHEKAVEKKAKWDAGKEGRAKVSASFKKLMGESSERMVKRHKKEIKEENEKAWAKEDAAREKKNKDDAAELKRWNDKHGKHDSSLLQDNDWADVLIAKFTSRRLLALDEGDKALDATAEREKMKKLEEKHKKEWEADLKRSNSDVCRALNEKSLAQCGLLTAEANQSCEMQLQAADGDFRQWLNPLTGSKEGAKGDDRHNLYDGTTGKIIEVTGEGKQTEASKKEDAEVKEEKEEAKKEEQKKEAKAAKTKPSDKAEKATGEALEDAKKASEDGDNKKATEKTEKALDEATKAINDENKEAADDIVESKDKDAEAKLAKTAETAKAAKGQGDSSDGTF